MAAFSYSNSLLLDSGFFEDEGSFNSTLFPQFYHDEALEQVPFDHCFKVCVSDDNEVAMKQNTESSTIVDKLESGEQVTQNMVPIVKKTKIANGHCSNSSYFKDPKEGKRSKQRKWNSDLKDEEEKKKKKKKKTRAYKESEKKVAENPPIGYIHVRARRGQATDSHSLAERVRREKISERMKILQKLVPGCDKVTGKALMLDEIINYVQSLQYQVEFLSMKLASSNPMISDYGQDLNALVMPPEALTNMAPSLPECSPTFTPVTTNYPFFDASASILLQQDQKPNALVQYNGSDLWGMNYHINKIMMTTSGFSNFH